MCIPFTYQIPPSLYGTNPMCRLSSWLFVCGLNSSPTAVITHRRIQPLLLIQLSSKTMALALRWQMNWKHDAVLLKALSNPLASQTCPKGCHCPTERDRQESAHQTRTTQPRFTRPRVNRMRCRAGGGRIPNGVGQRTHFAALPGVCKVTWQKQRDTTF